MEKGDRYIMKVGACGCGHIGPQRDPAQCGRCKREETRVTTSHKRQMARDRQTCKRLENTIDRLISRLPEVGPGLRQKLKQALDNLQ